MGLEVSSLFRLMSEYIHQEIDEISKEDNIHVRFMGRWDRLPERAKQDLQFCLDKTANDTAI